MYEEKTSGNYFFDLKESTNIYRYTTVERLFEMFDDKQLVLVKPKLWEDPFENILSKVIYNDGVHDISLTGITDTYYGQCWTKSKECDGLWRNYTDMGNKPNQGVKITTQTHKLYQYVSDSQNDKFSRINTFIGNVKYDTDNNIIDFFKSLNIHWITDTSGKNPSKTLYLKRKEFKYENEVRIIKSVNNNDTLNEVKILKVSIDPFDLITSIVFSPKMDDKIYDENRQKLIGRGFDINKISKSKLYDSFSKVIRIN